MEWKRRNTGTTPVYGGLEVDKAGVLPDPETRNVR